MRTYSTVFPVGEPISWEVRRTRMLVSKSPHTTMLLAHRRIVDKGEHKKHIKSFGSRKPCRKAPLSTKHIDREGHVVESIDRRVVEPSVLIASNAIPLCNFMLIELQIHYN